MKRIKLSSFLGHQLAQARVAHAALFMTVAQEATAVCETQAGCVGQGQGGLLSSMCTLIPSSCCTNSLAPLHNQSCHVQGVVKCVDASSLTLTDGTTIPFGLCIWSTGVGPTPFTLSLPFAKTKVGRIAVDPYLRVLAPPHQDDAGYVRGEGEPVKVKGQVRLAGAYICPHLPFEKG
jgi:hypothetical protein